VIEAVPVAARSVAGTTAVSCVALTNVVAMLVPSNAALELGTKLVPVRVNVAVPPTETVDGLIDVSVGTGFFTVNV